MRRGKTRTLGVMSPPTTLHYRYVAESTWLPTYLGITAVVLGLIENTALASVVLVLSLLLFRMALELVYRLAFGDARLHLRTQLAAFGAQVIVWSLIWTWHAQRTGAA